MAHVFLVKSKGRHVIVTEGKELKRTKMGWPLMA